MGSDITPSNATHDQSKPKSKPKTKTIAKNVPKQPTDRHMKVNGRDRRIRLPQGCAGRVFQLNAALRHRTCGQTIEWLLAQAKPAVDAVLSCDGAIPASSVPLPYEPVFSSYDSLMWPTSAYKEARVMKVLPENTFRNTTVAGSRFKTTLPPLNYGVETSLGMELSPEEIASMLECLSD